MSFALTLVVFVLRGLVRRSRRLRRQLQMGRCVRSVRDKVDGHERSARRTQLDGLVEHSHHLISQWVQIIITTAPKVAIRLLIIAITVLIIASTVRIITTTALMTITPGA
jgi:hypothetical protein